MAAFPKIPKDITYGDKYGPAMTIETQEDANAYLERLVYQESDNRMRVRLRSKDHNTGEQSLHFLLATRDILNMVSRQFRAMSAGVLAALKEKGINVDHLNQALEDLDA